MILPHSNGKNTFSLIFQRYINASGLRKLSSCHIPVTQKLGCMNKYWYLIASTKDYRAFCSIKNSATPTRWTNSRTWAMHHDACSDYCTRCTPYLTGLMIFCSIFCTFFSQHNCENLSRKCTMLLCDQYCLQQRQFSVMKSLQANTTEIC